MKRWPVVLIWVLALTAVAPLAADDADFRGQVAPIFEQHCLNCHQGANPKGGLSLQTRAALLTGGESGPAIVPGQAEESLLIQYISGEKPEMPKGGAALRPEQIAALRHWIERDAAWPSGVELKNAQRSDESWWAFQPVVRRQTPTVKDQSWCQNPLDAFVLTALEARNLRPAPPADKATLLRRVTFDLTGLPPTPQEIDEFQADPSPQGYSKVVDRLLASPRFGERWGRHWLDVAHYADTHGFESDGRRANAWRYRDYVIGAMNSDQPFDEFLREQVAADVISNHKPGAMAALGFLGTGPWDKIGHEAKAADLRRRARADELDDMVTTVIASTLGLTINCARCHDHKFDPLPQRDYYRLVAVLAGVAHGERSMRPDTASGAPLLAKLRSRLAEIKAELASIDGLPLDLADVVAGGNGFGSGAAGQGIDPRSGEPSRGKLGILPGLEAGKFVPAHVPLVDGIAIPRASGGKVTISSTGLAIELPATDGGSWDYVQPGPVLAQDKTATGGIEYAAAGHSMIALHANKILTFDIAAVRRAVPRFRALRFQTVAAYGGISPGARADFAVYVDGSLRAGRQNIDYNSGPIPIDVPIGPDERFLTLVATDGGNGIAFDQIFFGDPHLVPEAANATDQLAATAARQKLLDEQSRLERELAEQSDDQKVYAVVSQAAPPTHVLKRGDPESPQDEVSPGGLSVLKSLDPDFGPSEMPEAQRRARLASWLTDPANPLVGRVAVNRLWHYHFGSGIVATPSDFGFNGDRPSHPELLDWLASELMQHGWSLKHLHRTIVMSNSYRQASQGDVAAEAVDRGNRLLWRTNRRRLEAEAVRDSILAISGKLNLQAGGPGYEDFQYIEKYAPVYKYVTADRPELWRRTVYHFNVRSVPNEWLEAFDCPNPSILMPARNHTTTALAALALLNNPFVLAQAGYFAERLEREAPGDLPSQVRLAYRLAFGREPSDAECATAEKFVSGEDLRSFCHVLLNANELVYVD